MITWKLFIHQQLLLFHFIIGASLFKYCHIIRSKEWKAKTIFKDLIPLSNIPPHFRKTNQLTRHKLLTSETREVIGEPSRCESKGDEDWRVYVVEFLFLFLLLNSFGTFPDKSSLSFVSGSFDRLESPSLFSPLSFFSSDIVFLSACVLFFSNISLERC